MPEVPEDDVPPGLVDVGDDVMVVGVATDTDGAVAVAAVELEVDVGVGVGTEGAAADWEDI